jgi:putative oxidoreductase
MKLLIFAARILLGLAFFIFGLNHIVPFIHMPMPGGDEGALMGVMFVHKWFVFYGVVDVAAGLMLLLGRFVPLALTLLAGMGVNILLTLFTFAPSQLAMPLFLAVLEILLVYAYRDSFAGIFRAKAEPTLR